MALQPEIIRGRIARLTTGNVAAAPADGVTQPALTLGPKTSTGLETTGFALGLKAPTAGAATAIAAGFSVVVWYANPVTLAWFAGASTSIPYDQLFTTFDVDAAAIYFQIAAASVSVAGDVDFHIFEQ